jgi:DNA-binding PadR family transcriptional regulator
VSSDLPETSYAVLGLIDKRSASGYDLAALADRSLGYFWPISRTLVYRELARLEALGWAEATDVAQDRLPDKRVWSTTAQGRRALADWLSRSAEGGSSFRSAFLLKFVFGARMPPTALASLVADYRESLQGTATDLSTLVERLTNSPGASMGRLAALHGLRTAEARLAWLDEVEAELTLPSPAAMAQPRATSPSRACGGTWSGPAPAGHDALPAAPRP